jgi:hypothetical protein
VKARYHSQQIITSLWRSNQYLAMNHGLKALVIYLC